MSTRANIIEALATAGTPTRLDENCVEELKEMLTKGRVNINDVDPQNGASMLHKATIYGNKKIVDFLISEGIDPFITDNFNRTAQEVAIEHIQESTIKHGEDIFGCIKSLKIYEERLTKETDEKDDDSE